MKYLALLMLCAAATLSGQDLRTTAAAKAACGPAEISFEKGDGLVPHPAPIDVEAGKALVYIFGVQDPLAATCIGGNCGAVIKIGVDAQWTGAVRGNSFIAASVSPGIHHLCANWQTHEKALSEVVVLSPLEAEAGKTYFFAAHITQNTQLGGSSGLNLSPINEDEGRMLREAYPESKARPKR